MAHAQAHFDGFPVAEDKPAKSGVALYLELCLKHGGLIPQSMLASALGVSKQRITQFVSERRFPVHRIGAHNYVTGDDLEAFMQQERKHGRPFKSPGMAKLVEAGTDFVKTKGK